MIRRWTTIAGERPKFFDGAGADPVCLAQGAVDRPRFGDAHLSPMHKIRDVGRIGVPVADESLRRGLLKTVENPATGSDVKGAGP